MKAVYGLLVFFLILFVAFSGESIHDRNMRWQEELQYCMEEDRLYQILDSMETYREYTYDEVYQECKNKILTTLN